MPVSTMRKAFRVLSVKVGALRDRAVGVHSTTISVEVRRREGEEGPREERTAEPGGSRARALSGPGRGSASCSPAPPRSGRSKMSTSFHPASAELPERGRVRPMTPCHLSLSKGPTQT